MFNRLQIARHMFQCGESTKMKKLIFSLIFWLTLFTGCRSEFQNPASSQAGAVGPKGDTGPSPLQGPQGPAGAVGATGPDCFGSTCSGDTTFSGILSMSGRNLFTGDPSAAGIANGTVFINPTSAGSTETLLGVADNGTALFKMNGDGNAAISCTPQGSGLTQGCMYINSTAGAFAQGLIEIQDQSSTLNTINEEGYFDNSNAQVQVGSTLTVMDGSTLSLVAQGGHLVAGSVGSSTSLQMDTEVIVARDAPFVNSTLNINALGGNVELGDSSSTYTTPATLSMTKYQNAFHCSKTAGHQAVAVATSTQVTFDTCLVNDGSNFDLTTDVYAVPYTGYYLFYANIEVFNYTNDEEFYLRIFVDNVEVGTLAANITHSNGILRFVGGMVILSLTAGQEVDVRVDSVADNAYNVRLGSTFGGVRVY